MSDFVLRECRSEDVGAVLQLWREAEATPGVADTADDLRRAVAEGPTAVLVPRSRGESLARSSGRSTAGGATSTDWPSIPITGDRE